MSRIESFEIEIPQLNRSRIVWVYLPDGYDDGDCFPVIYMQDGQNCFYDRLCRFGNSWRAAETMDEIDAKFGYKAIVVAVESDERFRLSEYSPWKIAFGAFKAKRTVAKSRLNRGGDGDKYAEFFVKNLMTEVNSRYKTEKVRQGNAVIGSSMGGLISAYLGLEYQRQFSQIGLFSTYTEFNQKRWNRFVKKTVISKPTRAVIYCGGKEGDEFTTDKRMKCNSVKLYDDLVRSGVDCRLVLESGNAHNELAWRQFFGVFALDFLQRYYDNLPTE